MTLALICVLIAGIMPVVSAGIAKAGLRNYDNRNPRDWLAKQSGYRQRANAAQANAWEAFPFFAVGVLAAQSMGVAQGRIDTLALSFVLLRVLYLAMYLADLALLRSIVWIAAWGISISLYLAKLW